MSDTNDKEIENAKEAIDNNMKLTQEQKKTLKEWIVYLGKALLKAIIQKLSTTTAVVVLLSASLCGCETTESVIFVKPWEGHYKTTNTFYTATQNIQLDENETIWVLSSRTLKRILKNVEK